MVKTRIDLTQTPPRSPRVRLGGYVLLARMIDKGRATLAGTNGDYHYDCPLDQQFTKFAGIDAAALKDQLAAGKGDGEIIEWISAHSTAKPSAAQIEAWSAHQAARSPADLDSIKFFLGVLESSGPHRKDIATWFDLLDLDDFASYGGKP